MPKYLKAALSSVLFIIFLCSLALAEERLTVTAFYPSPAGSYNSLYVKTGLGVGITAPSVSGVKAQITGDISTANRSSGIGQLWVTGSTNSNKSLVLGYDTTADVGFIQAQQYGSSTSHLSLEPNGGSVGIGTASPGYLLDVAGAAHASSFPTSSDIRFKTNIVQLVEVLPKLETLRGVAFDWNQQYQQLGRATPGRQIGLLAQEVEQAFPELVTTWGGDNRAVDYGRFTAVLLEAIKEQQAQINTLRSEIESLKANKK